MKKLIVLILISWFSFGASYANSTQENKRVKSGREKVIRVREHALVTMKDGTQVKVVVLGRQTKNKFWVRKIGSKRQGLVHKKYIMPLSARDT